MISQQIRFGMREALVSSMAVVFQHQMPEQAIAMGSVTRKSDGTILTTADKASEKVGKAILLRISGVSVHGEETGLSGKSTSGIKLYGDFLDGSMPYALAALTSTVIVAAV